MALSVRRNTSHARGLSWHAIALGQLLHRRHKSLVQGFLGQVESPSRRIRRREHAARDSLR